MMFKKLKKCESLWRSLPGKLGGLGGRQPPLTRKQNVGEAVNTFFFATGKNGLGGRKLLFRLTIPGDGIIPEGTNQYFLPSHHFSVP